MAQLRQLAIQPLPDRIRVPLNVGPAQGLVDVQAGEREGREGGGGGPRMAGLPAAWWAAAFACGSDLVPLSSAARPMRAPIQQVAHPYDSPKMFRKGSCRPGQVAREGG